MTYCTKLFEALEKRLQEKKSLDEIGQELCSDVKDPRGKVIRIIKEYKDDGAEEYLRKNADWLGYHYDRIPDDVGHSLAGRKNAIGEDVKKNSDIEPQEVEGCEIDRTFGGAFTEEEQEEQGEPRETQVPSEIHDTQPRSTSDDVEDVRDVKISTHGFTVDFEGMLKNPLGKVDLTAKTVTLPFGMWYLGEEACKGTASKAVIEKMNIALQKATNGEVSITYIDISNQNPAPRICLPEYFVAVSESGLYIGSNLAMDTWLMNRLGAEKYEEFSKERQRQWEEEKKLKETELKNWLRETILELAAQGKDERQIQKEIHEEHYYRIYLGSIKDVLECKDKGGVGDVNIKYKYTYRDVSFF